MQVGFIMSSTLGWRLPSPEAVRTHVPECCCCPALLSSLLRFRWSALLPFLCPFPLIRAFTRSGTRELAFREERVMLNACPLAFSLSLSHDVRLLLSSLQPLLLMRACNAETKVLSCSCPSSSCSDLLALSCFPHADAALSLSSPFSFVDQQTGTQDGCLDSHACHHGNSGSRRGGEGG